MKERLVNVDLYQNNLVLLINIHDGPVIRISNSVVSDPSTLYKKDETTVTFNCNETSTSLSFDLLSDNYHVLEENLDMKLYTINGTTYIPAYFTNEPFHYTLLSDGRAYDVSLAPVSTPDPLFTQPDSLEDFSSKITSTRTGEAKLTTSSERLTLIETGEPILEVQTV